MNTYREYLRLRRELLVSQAAAQRSEIAYTVAHMGGSLRLMDAAFALARSSRHIAPVLMPALAAAGGLLLWAMPRGKLWRWGGRLLAAWKLFRFVQRRRSEAA